MLTKKQLIGFERRVASLWERGKIRVPVHLSGGNEDELLKIFTTIKKDDYVFSTHRNHFHYLLKTGDVDGLLDEIMGKESGVCGGHSGSMHTISHKHRFYASGIVGGCVAMAVGVAAGIKRNGGNNKVYCFLGDAGTDEGWFFEAWRYAIGHDLPITYVIEDNDRSVCTSKKQRWGQVGVDVAGQKIVRYTYKGKYPHVGTGKPIDW